MRVCLHIIVLMLLSQLAVKAQIPARPEPQRLYNNLSEEFPDFLNATEAAALEQKLERFSNETSNQICVVVVDDLGGQDASQFAFDIGNKWGVGQKELDNGIVILVKPTGKAGGRDLFIATGHGIEGALPDLMTKRIRDNVMVPLLAEGHYYEALDQGVDALMQVAKGEYHVKDKRVRGDKSVSWPAIIVILIVLLIVSRLFRRSGGYTYSGRGRRHVPWGGFGGFGGGRGFGGGGGGWGGFGGGSFGGGGSGGKW